MGFPTLISDILADPEVQKAVLSRSSGVLCLETPYGMLLREQGYIDRIHAGECSYEFMVEIAESTLTFIQIKSLLQNMIARREPTPETMNIDCMVASIVKSIDFMVPDQSRPFTAFCYVRPENGGDLDYEPNMMGRGLKRYPQSYKVPQ